MRFGAMNFPVLPVANEIESFAALGFDYLELAMDPPAAHYLTLRQSGPAIRAALAAARMGLVCHLPTFVSTADLTDSIRRASVGEILASLETAAELGAEKAVLHPGHIRGMGSFVREKAMALAVDSLSVVVEAAERIGLTLCLENMFPAYGAFFEADELAPLFERFPSLQMTLDTGHAHIASPHNRRIAGLVSRFGGRIAHVHLSDNPGDGDRHLPLGAGTIDFKAVARDLKAIGYDDTVTLEIFTGDRRDLTASRRRFAKLMSAAR
jgi:sugar phosphate isomerase/epimerase